MTVCTCGAPLTSLVEQWTGECQACCVPAFESPFLKDDVMRSAVASSNTSALIRRIHPRDAARDAAHGYDIEHELRQVGPDEGDLLPECAACGDLFESDDPNRYLCALCQMSEVS